MADIEAPVAAPVSNGIGRLDAARSATLAALVAGEDKAPVEKAPVETTETEEVEEAAEEVEDIEEEQADEEESEEETEDDAEDEAAKADPDLAKRLAQVRKTERRGREALAKERAEAVSEFRRKEEAFVAEWKPKVERAERFDALSKQVRYKAVDVLLELGVKVDDLEDIARECYAHSPKGAAEPRNKDAVTRTAREKELASRLEATEKKMADREAAEAKRESEAKNHAEGMRYLGEVEKAATADKHPVAARDMAKNAEKTRARIAGVAGEIWDSTGKRPEPASVLKAYEKIRREEIEDAKEAATVLTAPGKVAGSATAKKPPPKTSPAPTATKSLKDERAETLRLIEEGKLD